MRLRGLIDWANGVIENCLECALRGERECTDYPECRFEPFAKSETIKREAKQKNIKKRV